MARHRFLHALSAPLVLAVSHVACGGTASPTPGAPPPAPTEGAPPGAVPPTAPPAANPPASGTLGGQPTTVASGFFLSSDEGRKVSLVLSDRADLCASAQHGGWYAGETRVMLWELEGTPGDEYKAPASAPDQPSVTYQRASATCAKGVPMDSDLGRVAASSSRVTFLNVLPDRAIGALELHFEDGSVIQGHFDVPTCAGSPFAHPACF